MTDVDLQALTGLDFTSLDEAEYYYQSHAPEGAPPFSEDVLPYLKRLQGASTWDEVIGKTAVLDDITDRAANVRRAIYPSSPSDTRDTFNIPDDCHEQFDEALERAAGAWNPDHTDDVILEVYEAFCRLVPNLGLVSANHDPNTAEWHWARLRCFFASAGYPAHARIAALMNALYPHCDLDEAESRREWDDKLLTAHKLCGWPATLGWVTWDQFNFAMKFAPKDQFVPDKWHRAVAALHVLKHMRTDETDGAYVVTYKGVAASVPMDLSLNVIGHSMRHRTPVLKALGGRLGLPRGLVSVMTASLEHVLNKLTRKDMLTRKRRASLPGVVLWGPWSTLTPDPQQDDGFIQHGLRLDGVWLASNGKVRETSGDTEDIVGYDWNVVDPNVSAYQDARTAFVDALPAAYQAGSPFDLFHLAYPNLVFDHLTDPDAAAALFDTPLYASMLRPHVGELAYEFPMVLFQPDEPSFEASTNQGKSLAALVYAKVMVPSIHLQGVTDSQSAPDLRALAHDIRTYGTIALDEWRQPKTKSHLLCHENLQMLCTGARVTSGRVLENSGSVHLTHSVVIACKAVDFPPDMQNRSLVWWLRPFTDAQRNRPDVLAAARNGRLSTEMRLAMLGTVDQFGLVGALRQAAKASSNTGMRFETHRALAVMLYIVRTGASQSQAEQAIDQASEQMREHLKVHTAFADHSGVLSSLEEGQTVRLRLSSVFADLTTRDVTDMVNAMDFAAQTSGNKRVSVIELLRARAAVAGLQNRPLHALLPYLTGQSARCSDRVVIQSLASDIKAQIPKGGEWALPGTLGLGGWVLERGSESTPQLRLRQNQPWQLQPSDPTTLQPDDSSDHPIDTEAIDPTIDSTP